MPKQSLASIAKSVRTAMKKHSPEILTGIGIAGMITTTVMAVKATPKALILLEEKKDELDTDRLEPKDIIKTAWPCYIPAAVVGAISVFCLIGASSTNLRRNAALATAYTLSESTLKEYQEKVVETIGEKKEQSIRDSVSKDKMVKNPVREVILTESGGNTICYDVLSGRYFKSDRDKITRVMNELNRQMRDEMHVTLNDFYYELGLDGTKMGDMLGWNIDKGYIDLAFSSQLDSAPRQTGMVRYNKSTIDPSAIQGFCVNPLYLFRERVKKIRLFFAARQTFLRKSGQNALFGL